MEINRSFNHRTFGALGTATLAVNAVEKDKLEVLLNGNALPDVSVQHLFTFALQTLQDAYAGAKTEDEAKASFAKKLDAIINGTIGVRGSGGAAESETDRIRRRLVLANFKTALGKDWKTAPKWVEFDALSPEEQAAKLDAAYAKNEAHFAPIVDAEIARLETQRKNRAAAIASNVVIDL